MMENIDIEIGTPNEVPKIDGRVFDDLSARMASLLLLCAAVKDDEMLAVLYGTEELMILEEIREARKTIKEAKRRVGKLGSLVGWLPN